MFVVQTLIRYQSDNVNKPIKERKYFKGESIGIYTGSFSLLCVNHPAEQGYKPTAFCFFHFDPFCCMLGILTVLWLVTGAFGN